jgi:hypothetical protein
MNTENNSLKTRIIRWEMWGILFIIVLGALLHFTFEWSHYWKPLGIISAVNESVWEHLKLAFWPALIWTIIEYFQVYRSDKNANPNFLTARAIGAYLMPVIIVIIFYSYTAFTGESILAVDLSSFVIAVIIGQAVASKLWLSWKLPAGFNWLGLALFIAGILLFAVFTFYPPAADIFKDPPTGGYGIIP